MPKSTGQVKWFNSTKGFGFIIPDDGSEEIFVHQSSLKSDGFRSLREEEKVEYDIDATAGERTKAVNVTGPDGANVLGAKRVFRRQKRRAPLAGEGGATQDTANNEE